MNRDVTIVASIEKFLKDSQLEASPNTHKELKYYLEAECQSLKENEWSLGILKAFQVYAEKNCLVFPGIKQPQVDDLKEQIKKSGSKLGYECIFCYRQLEGVKKLELKENQYTCAQCILKRLQPFSEIEATLIDGFEFQTRAQSQPLDCSLKNRHTFQVDSKYRNQEDMYLDFRCVKLTDEGMHDITYPENCKFLLNDEVLHETSSLLTNSSQKKRRDHQVYKETNILKYGGENNHIRIKENLNKQGCRQEKSSSQYMISLYLVKKIQPRELIEKIKIKQINQGVEYFKGLLKNHYESQNISGERMQKQCQIDFEVLITPVRGKYCNHQHCFCLEHFIQLNHSIKDPNWKCMICKKPLLNEFIIDQYQEEIIKNSTGIKDVYIQSDGSYNLQQSNQQIENQEFVKQENNNCPTSCNNPPQFVVKNWLGKKSKNQIIEISDEESKPISNHQESQFDQQQKRFDKLYSLERQKQEPQPKKVVKGFSLQEPIELD